MTGVQIAVMTCGLLHAPIDHSDVAEFVARSPAVWERAALFDGYRGHIDEEPDLRPARFSDDRFRLRCAITLSCWRDLDAVHAFVYGGTNHTDALRDRRRWFVAGDRPTQVAWWLSRTERPTQADGVARYEQPDSIGPTRHAFDLRHAFAADGQPMAIRRQPPSARTRRPRAPHVGTSDTRE